MHPAAKTPTVRAAAVGAVHLAALAGMCAGTALPPLAGLGDAAAQGLTGLVVAAGLLLVAGSTAWLLHSAAPPAQAPGQGKALERGCPAWDRGL